MKLSPTLQGVSHLRNQREAKHLGEVEAFKGAWAEAEKGGDIRDVNRVLLMGCFRLAQFTGQRQLNRRVARARRNRDLLRRDFNRGHDTPRVRRALTRFLKTNPQES